MASRRASPRPPHSSRSFPSPPGAAGSASSSPTYSYPHVLVIDEVGYLSSGPVAANVLFRVVNGRYLAHSAATSPSLHRAPGGGYVPGDATYHGAVGTVIPAPLR